MELLGSDTLRQKAERVTEFDEELEGVIANMKETLIEQDGIGLAGPQVGFLKRIFLIRLESGIMEFINPSIIEMSVETEDIEEGCLSIPGVFVEIKRASRVKIQAQNMKGKVFTLPCGGILARAVQHEYDHLEGKLFIDYLSDVKRERVINRYEKIRQKKAKPQKKRKQP
jgi:peptide deformylase